MLDQLKARTRAGLAMKQLAWALKAERAGICTFGEALDAIERRDWNQIRVWQAQLNAQRR